MRYRFTAAFLFFVLAAQFASAAESETTVEIRKVNNGQVVLENVPPVPDDLRDRINRYQNTRGATFRDWAKDGQGIYITTRFGNVSQIHHVTAPGAARRQLTFYDEPVSSTQRRPGTAQLTFLMDSGGSEFSQIFLFDTDAGTTRMISDGESRNGAMVWSDDGGKLAFQSTRRNGRSNDIWMLTPDAPEQAELLVESPDGSWWGPFEWSADGSKLLIANYVSITDSRIHVYDAATGQLRLLAGGTENPSNTATGGAEFDAAGNGIFFATDAGGDFTRLAYFDLATGETELITESIPWNVEQLSLSDDGTRGAFVTNEGGIGSLFLFNPQSREYRRVEQLPIGLIRGVSFDPQGRRLAMTLNAPKTPSDVFTLELQEDPLEAGELTRWTYSEVGGIDTETLIEPELIQYESFDGRMIPAFVYRPQGPGPFPVIVGIHGGPEAQYRPGFSSTYQMWLNELGAAVIAPNVRGSAGYGREYVKLDNGFNREDSVKDIGALLDWIDEQPELDASRVAVVGGSYGGYMVLASMVHYSDRLQAGVDVVGISNFVTFLENTQDYRRDLRRVEYGDERDPEMREFLETISPNRNVAKITAPLFVAQGQNDPRVPVTESEQIVRAVRDAGYEVWYMNALNEGHGFRKKENADLYGEITVMFLRKHLAGE